MNKELEYKEQRKRQLELTAEINTKIAELSQRLDVVENNRRLGSDAHQRIKFLEDNLEEPVRVVVSKQGEVYKV